MYSLSLPDKDVYRHSLRTHHLSLTQVSSCVANDLLPALVVNEAALALVPTAAAWVVSGRHRLKALNPILQLAMPDAFPSWGEHPEDCQNSWESHQPSTCRVTRVRDERAS